MAVVEARIGHFERHPRRNNKQQKAAGTKKQQQKKNRRRRKLGSSSSSDDPPEPVPISLTNRVGGDTVGLGFLASIWVVHE